MPHPGPPILLLRGPRGCISLVVRAAGERMVGRLRARDDRVDRRQLLQCALDRLLRRAVVEVEDLLVVLGIPVDEHADADAESSTLSRGITPLDTESTTARATAAWAGPNICTACLAPLIVTLL